MTTRKPYILIINNGPSRSRLIDALMYAYDEDLDFKARLETENKYGEKIYIRARIESITHCGLKGERYKIKGFVCHRGHFEGDYNVLTHKGEIKFH